MKNQKGITLVALIITIVVIMILVAVSVTVALQSGLFSATSKAASDTRAAAEKENELAAGKVTVEGTEYNSIQEYIDTLGGSTGSGSGEMITFTFFHESYTVEEGTTWGEFVAYFNSLSTPAEPGCGQTGCGWTRGRWFDGTAFYYNGCECGTNSIISAMATFATMAYLAMGSLVRKARYMFLLRMR